VAFQGGDEAPVADGGGRRHLQYRRGEGMVRGKAIWPKKAWRMRSSRIMVGGGVDSESGCGCGALVSQSEREAGGVSVACTGRKRKKEWRRGATAMERHPFKSEVGNGSTEGAMQQEGAERDLTWRLGGTVGWQRPETDGWWLRCAAWARARSDRGGWGLMGGALLQSWAARAAATVPRFEFPKPVKRIQIQNLKLFKV
jgi:hypothetical protein